MNNNNGILTVNTRGNSRDEQSLINDFIANNKIKQTTKGKRRAERHTFKNDKGEL